jgi:uncharacterized protein YqfA (UPF0365 family)
VLSSTSTLLAAGALLYNYTATTTSLRAALAKEQELRAKDIAQEQELRAKDNELLRKDIAKEQELRAKDVQLIRAETNSEMRVRGHLNSF